MHRCICIKGYVSISAKYFFNEKYYYDIVLGLKYKDSNIYCVYFSEGSPIAGDYLIFYNDNDQDFNQYFIDIKDYREQKLNQVIDG